MWRDTMVTAVCLSIFLLPCEAGRISDQRISRYIKIFVATVPGINLLTLGSNPTPSISIIIIIKPPRLLAIPEILCLACNYKLAHFAILRTLRRNSFDAPPLSAQMRNRARPSGRGDTPSRAPPASSHGTPHVRNRRVSAIRCLAATYRILRQFLTL